MVTRRLRMFAGPNGSGKSTVSIKLQEMFDFGVYLNADDIEVELKNKSKIILKDYGIKSIVPDFFKNFIAQHSLLEKAKQDGYNINLAYENNEIICTGQQTHSYEATILVDFIRQNLIENGKKLTFETVMSHSSKIDILKFAQESGYKNYLYFISTSDPKINKSRVSERIKKGGHPVPEEKIEERYYKSLELLKEAISYTHRAYIFDNSGDESKLILSIKSGEAAKTENITIPSWVNDYVGLGLN